MACGRAEMSAQRSPKTWRRWLRTSVRGLCILVLVIGAGLGWVVHQAHDQRDSVAAIKGAGGIVFYDWQWGGHRRATRGKPWAPRWLVKLMGVDYFGHVTWVSLEWATDPVMEQVGRLSGLQYLQANGSSLGDTGLSHLKGLTGLSQISLTRTQITDLGLAHLNGMTNLAVAVLDSSQVSDAGLMHLAGLRNLSKLDLQDTMVTDAGLVHLKGLTKLSKLYLSGTRVSDAGLMYVKGMTGLTQLHVKYTQVTDSGVKELKRALPRLHVVH